MPFAYIVRCRFTKPAREQAWNDWYSGPKIAQMLAKPHFRTCQRFRLTAGHGRAYLALWLIDSAEAFKTREYTSDWGFFDWSPFITDWSRDLFDAGDTPMEQLAVPLDGALAVTSFDGASLADAEKARAGLDATEPATIWMPVTGLDRHTPMIGLRALATAPADTAPDNAGQTGAQSALYRPICRQFTAG